MTEENTDSEGVAWGVSAYFCLLQWTKKFFLRPSDKYARVSFDVCVCVYISVRPEYPTGFYILFLILKIASVILPSIYFCFNFI